MKCHPNYATQEDKNNNQIPTLLLTYTQALMLQEGILGSDLMEPFCDAYSNNYSIFAHV